MRRLLLGCVLVLLAGAWPAAAPAQAPGLIPGSVVGTLAGGPVLSGDGVVWIADRGGERRVIRAVGGSRRVLHRWRPGVNEGAAVAASAETVAVHRFGEGPRLEELRVGGPEGPLERIDGCGATGAAACARWCGAGNMPSVSGRSVAWRLGCPNLLRVRDGAGTVRSVAGARIAGPFYIGSTSGRTTVRDVATGAERLAVGHTPNTYALDADGAVVFSLTSGGESRAPVSDIFIATPEQPEPRKLAHVRGVPELAIAGDRVAWTASVATSPTPRVEVVRRDGSFVAGGSAPGLLGPISFDGRRMSWGVLPCRRWRVAVWSLEGSPPGQPTGCGRLGVRSARLSHDGRSVRVAVTCPRAPAGGCGSTLGGSLRRGPRQVAGMHEEILALEPGERASVRLAIRYDRHRRRGARRAGVARLTILDRWDAPRRRVVRVPLGAVAPS